MPKYSTVHWHIRKQRGPASDYRCVSCGGPAQEWAYKESTGYSQNIYDYSPKCKKCHAGERTIAMYDFTCPYCDKPAQVPLFRKTARIKNNQAGPYCSRSCATKSRRNNDCCQD